MYDLNMLEDSVPNSNEEGMINFRCVCVCVRKREDYYVSN